MYFIIYFAIVASLFGQSIERKSTPLPILSENYGVLTEAVGWTLTNSGQWVSASNRLPYRDGKSNKLSYAEYSIGRENFKKIELKKVKLDEIDYGLLLIYRKSGRYAYPNIFEGWYDFDELVWYAFPADKIKEVADKDIVFNAAYVVDLGVIYSGRLNNIEEELSTTNLLHSILSAARGEFSLYSDYKVSLALFPIEDKSTRVMRFRIAEENCLFSSGKSSDRIKTDTFDKSYFEVDFVKFVDLVNGLEE